MIYICERCGAEFEEPGYESFCYEDEYGVSSMFSTRHYGEYQVCPECGCPSIECSFKDEDEEECEE